MPGALILDLPTIISAPRFFAIFALVERAVERRIVVLDTVSNRKDGERLAAGLGIPLHDYVLWDGTVSKDAQAAKVKVVRSYLTKHSPVIWVDVDFGQWTGEKLEGIPNLVIVNWAELVRRGAIPPVPMEA